MKNLILLGVIGVGTISTANAAVISGVSASASSTIAGSSFDRGPGHVVDGSGTNFATGVTVNTPVDGTMWLDNGNGAYGGRADTTPFILFNLGAAYNLASVTVWNYNEVNLPSRGIASTDIYTSTNGIFFTLLQHVTLNEAPGTTSSFGQNVSLSPVTAQYVEFENFTQFAGDDNNVQGLSEVQFQSVAATVPEPASMALLGVGLVGLYAARNRRTA